MNSRSRSTRLRAALAEITLRAAWAPLLVFAIHVPLSSIGFRMYDRHPLIDVPMHFFVRADGIRSRQEQVTRNGQKLTESNLTKPSWLEALRHAA